MTPIRMIAATGLLGYGFTEEGFHNGLADGVDFIAADGGSMDPGPHYLGAGEPFVTRAALKRDLTLMLDAAIERDVPMLIGSAGGGGGRPHVQIVREVVEEIAQEKGHHFKMATIEAEQDKAYLKHKRAAGHIEPLGPIAELDDETIDDSHRVVAMMGVEPFQAALRDGAQVVLAGRATDASIYAAIPLMRGAHPGLTWHMSKIIECAAQVAVPRTGPDSVVATLADDHFIVEPGHPDKRCTRMRVAAHTLYENPNPYEMEEPDGTIITSDSRYEQIDERRVKVTGSRFHPSNAYTVKLEGVRHAGFRTVFFAGVRDPTLIAVIDDFIASCQERVADGVAMLGIGREQYKLNVRVYGHNATMGAREPVKDAMPHEIGLLADVLADDAEISKAVMAKARVALLHTDFPGRKCISGNLAIPFSPSDMNVGPTYAFNIWHRMKIDDPMEPFSIEMVEV